MFEPCPGCGVLSLGGKRCYSCSVRGDAIDWNPEQVKIAGGPFSETFKCRPDPEHEAEIRAHERAAVLAEVREAVAEIRNDAYYKDDFEGGQALDQLLTLLFAPGGPLYGKGGE